MARIIYGALVESIRGSIGGTTFQANAYGHTVKKKPNIVKPNTPGQNTMKLLFARAVREWNNLTSAQRSDWDTWASTYPQYAKHNPSSQLSGFNVFVKRHVYQFLAGLAVDTNPTYVTYSPDTAIITLINDSTHLYLGLDSATSDGDWRIAFFLSRPFPASQNFIGTSTRYIFTNSNEDDSWDIKSEYLDLFGITPDVNQQVACDYVYFGSYNGQVLARAQTLITVTAS